MHALLSAIGITEIPYGMTEESLVHNAIIDNFFWNKCVSGLIESVATQVAARLHPIERESLRERLVPRNKSNGQVKWTLLYPEQSPNGVMLIMAAHGDKETIRWSGDAKNLRTLKFYGEPVPSDIASVYELQYSIGKPDPDAVQQNKDRLRWENERQARQSNIPTSYEAVLAAEAISKLPDVLNFAD